MDTCEDNISYPDASSLTNGSMVMSPEQWHAEIRDYVFPSPYEWAFVGLYVIVFIMGLGGNFIVCYAVWKNKHLRTVTNYFLVNLACADFLVILICLPFTLIHDIAQSWLFGLVMCKVVLYLQKVSVLVSVLTLTAISLERYMAICHPLSFRVSKYKTILVVSLIWILAMLVAIPDLVFLTLVPDDVIPANIGNIWLTACTPENPHREFVYQMFLTAAYYFLPLVVMGFAYTRIAMCLWKSTRAGPATNSSASEGNANTLRNRKRTAKMLIMVVVLFFICYLPVYLLNILRYSGALNHLQSSDEVMISVIALTARFMCYFNSAINPVIYNFMSEKFKKEFRVVCWCCMKLQYTRNQLRGVIASRTQNQSSEDQSGIPLRSVQHRDETILYKDGSMDYSDSGTEMTRLKPANHGSCFYKDGYYNGSPSYHQS